jgi:5-methylcytosine-specific restriction enzyme A
MGTGGRCIPCRRRIVAAYGTPADRGYDARWERNRIAFLALNLFCVLCGGLATVADHFPISRRQLVAMGVRNPDAHHRLRALCRHCHSTETARLQPGGWNRDQG